MASCLNIVKAKSDKLVLVRSTHFKSAPVSMLNEIVGPNNQNVLSTQSEEPLVAEGLQTAVTEAAAAAANMSADRSAAPNSSNDCAQVVVVVLCGSLFTVAEGREWLARQTWATTFFDPQDWVFSADSLTLSYK